MKLPARSIACLGILSLCVGGWFHSPLTAEELGIDFWNLGELEDQIARGESKNLELERNDQLILSRIGLRHEILKNLLEEKITLDQAARGFLALNHTEPSVITFLRITDPHGTDLDRATKQLVNQMAVFHLPGSQECHLRLKCELLGSRVQQMQ